MPRPKNPNARTASERALDSQRARDVVGMHLPRAVVDQLDAVRARDGDLSRVATVTRLIIGALSSRQ